MNRSNNLEIEEKNTVFLAKLYEDNPEDIKEYLLEQGLLFWNVDDWLQALMKYQYLLGTRIHGVISAVLAGIPATLIAHDERTSELAKRMNLPSIDLRNIDEFNEKTIIDSYNKCNFDRFNEKRAEYYLNFKDFFDQNEVSNTLKGWHEK
jgi:polysaccharide pyruvyl transferase WcaK-like protein